MIPVGPSLWKAKTDFYNAIALTPTCLNSEMIKRATEIYKATLLRASVGERAEVKAKDIIRTETLRQAYIKSTELEKLRVEAESRQFAFMRNHRT